MQIFIGLPIAGVTKFQQRSSAGFRSDQADVGACAQKLYTEISADRAGAVDADFHWASDCRGYKISAEIKRWLRGSSQNQGVGDQRTDLLVRPRKRVVLQLRPLRRTQC